MKEQAIRTTVMEIESLFDASADEGEFVRQSWSAQTLEDRHGEVQRVRVLTTKPAVLSVALAGGAEASAVRFFGAPGLPDASILPWLKERLGSRVAFIGDLDPPDFLICEWLRQSLAPCVVEHLALSDAVFAAMHSFRVDEMTIPFSPSEKAAWPRVQQLIPNLRALVGEQSWGLLQRHQKVECEAVLWSREEFANWLTRAIA